MEATDKATAVRSAHLIDCINISIYDSQDRLALAPIDKDGDAEVSPNPALA
jgi:hypothetical protein